MANIIKLTGFRGFERKMKTVPAVVKKEIGGEAEDSGKLWEQRAKQDVPVDQGLLRNSIKSSKTGEMAVEIGVYAEYGPYQEFGTKTRVRVPPDVAAYAAQFKGGGKGSGNAKKMIYEWMKRVGIPEERQWFVFVSIIVRGIHARPYFFPQKPIVEKHFITNCRRILNTEH